MITESTSRVTIVLPVYNCAAYLAQCLESLLVQTFRDFKLLVIDDGSSDGSMEIIQQYAALDKRIRIQRYKSNQGLVYVLNEAIAQCESEFIARMDADDWCEPERLAIQVEYLQRYPSVAIVGSWIQLFGDRDEVWHYRQQDAFIKAMLLFKTSGFSHSSLMARTRLLKDFPYDPAYRHVEDTELWTRIMVAQPHWEFANIPQVLTHYRVSQQQVSQRYRKEQEDCYQRIIRRLLEHILTRSVSTAEWGCHRQLMLEYTPDRLNHQQVASWYIALQEAYDRLFGDSFFAIDEKWLAYCQFYDLADLYRETSQVLHCFNFLSAKGWLQEKF